MALSSSSNRSGGYMSVDIEAAILTLVIGLFIACGAGAAVYYIFEGKSKNRRK